MRRSCPIFICSFWLGMASSLAYGQTSVSGGYGGIGDPAQAPGNPQSSYALTGIDHVNYYSGSVNVVIPILTIGGRGNVSRTIAIPIQRQWEVDNVYGSGPGTQLWNYLGGFYTSGFLSFSTSSPNPTYCYNPATNAYYGNQATSYIIWTAFDGTQTILTDTRYHGQPQDPDSSCNPADRDTVFQSTDGSGLTFIASSDVHDGDGLPNGTLFMRDGTKYVPGGNYIGEIQDRNGNSIQFSFSSTPSGGIYTVTDPVGRQTQINFTEDLIDDDQDVITYPGFNNTTHTITVNYTLLGGTDAQTGLPALAPGESLQTYQGLFPELSSASSASVFNPYVITSVVLADNSSYRMQYNAYGELVRLMLPTGGVYTYSYGEAYAGGSDGVLTLDEQAGYRIYRPLIERDEYADGIHLSARMLYSAQAIMAGTRPGTKAVVKFEDPQGNLLREEDHYFYGNALSTAAPPPANAYADWWEGLEYQTDILDGAAVLRSVQRLYQQRPWDPSETDPWFSTSADMAPLHDPQLCQVNLTQDGNATSGLVYSYDRYNNPTDIYEFDFGQAPALGSSCASGSGAARHTNIQYAGGSYLSHNLLSLPTQVTISDGGGNVYAQTTYAYDSNGNLLTQGRCLAGATPFDPATCGWQNTTFTYDAFGNLLTVTDANEHTTSYSYADSYSDGNNGRNTNAHVTQVTNALNQSQRIQYDYGTGKPTLVTDANGASTAYSYNDPLDRLTQVTYPNGGHTYYSYPSPTDVRAARDQNSPGDTALQSEILYDGLGRESETRQYESGGTYVSITTSYDALGRVAASTNPSRYSNGSGDGLNYVTQYAYDALGRRRQVQTADGAVSTMNYGADSSLAYALLTDPAGHQQQYGYNGLGQLVEVWEDPGTLNYLTRYGYDPLNDLTLVVQGGQSRNFIYNSLGLLVSASNPESGTIGYSYDAAGNLQSRTDARGIVTSYSYDALNRLTGKSYSDGTPAVSYGYDAGQNGIGHLTSVANANSTTHFLGFDSMGQVLASNQVTGGQVYGFLYTYDLAGSLKSEAYPSGRVVTMAYDGAERAIGVRGSLNGQSTSYISGVSYAPQGVAQQYSYGNQLWRSLTFTQREEWATSDDERNQDPGYNLLHQVYSWSSNGRDDNGTLRSVQFWHGGGPGTNWIEFQQTFSYDGANRLTAATDSGGWWRSFGYDQYGNLWVTGNGGVPLAGNTPTWNVYNGHNQISGISYDAAGNQLVANGDTLSYDAENRMVSATEPPALGGATETYVYDGNGQRVQKMGPNGTTTDVYDAFGNLAAEYGTVTSAACTTCYLSYDHLGSVRLVTDQNANVVARHDYLPFGEEIPANTAGRNSQWGLTADVEQKFTGQIRDNETGMDYFNARYFTGALGRFNSSDPLNLGADATDPQTWNGYAYVRNNPLALVDPMGLCTFDAEGNAVEDENGACYEGGFGGSVTVTASPPPDVMPIFVSLPSLLSDTQQPMQSAPPAVTETGVGIKPPKNGPRTCANGAGSGGIGLGAGYNLDLGVATAGASSTGGVGAGAFHNRGGGFTSGYSAGAFASGGATTYAGSHVIGIPQQSSSTVFALGAYAGAGTNLFVTNAASVQQLSGPFTTLSVNVGVGVAKLGGGRVHPSQGTFLFLRIVAGFCFFGMIYRLFAIHQR
jgi:RHS repeat-associated protein